MSLRQMLIVGSAVVVAAGLGFEQSAAQDKKAKEDYKVTLFEHGKFDGKSQVFRQGSPDLSKVQFGNRASSAKWTVPPDRAAVLYADKEYKRPVAIFVGSGELADFAKDCPNAQDAVSSVNFVAVDKDGYPKGVVKDVKKFGE